MTSTIASAELDTLLSITYKAFNPVNDETTEQLYTPALAIDIAGILFISVAVVMSVEMILFGRSNSPLDVHVTLMLEGGMILLIVQSTEASVNCSTVEPMAVTSGVGTNNSIELIH